MQEKIEEYIKGQWGRYMLQVSADEWVVNNDELQGFFESTAQIIATLFERKVIWEGEQVVRQQKAGMKRDIGYINLGKHGELFIYNGKRLDGQRVRVVVEGIE